MGWFRRARPRRMVAILGKMINVIKAPQEGVERWGINGSFRPLAHAFGVNTERFDMWDRWFDTHTLGHIQKHRPHALPWYRAQDARKPIYLLDRYEDIPASVALPIKELQRFYATPQGVEECFTSSLDWMMALAGMEGVDRIELWGVDLWAGKERATQRDGGHYWIGRLRGMGVDVFIPDESSMCKTERLYGSFKMTSGRNFSSMSGSRFIEQVKRAQAMKEPGYAIPGVDEGSAPAA